MIMTESSKLIFIKLTHTIIWIFFNVVIFYLLYAVIVDKIDKWIWIGLGLFLLEGIILIVFKMKCPLTVIARQYSDSAKDQRPRQVSRLGAGSGRNAPRRSQAADEERAAETARAAPGSRRQNQHPDTRLAEILRRAQAGIRARGASLSSGNFHRIGGKDTGGSGCGGKARQGYS